MLKAQTDADKAAADYWRNTAQGESRQAATAASMARSAEGAVRRDQQSDDAEARQMQRRRTLSRR